MLNVRDGLGFGHGLSEIEGDDDAGMLDGRKLCGVSLWRGTLWRGAKAPRETSLGEAGTEQQPRRIALISYGEVCIGFGERFSDGLSEGYGFAQDKFPGTGPE